MINFPQARRRLSAPKVKAFSNSISVDWADLMEEPSADVMAKVSIFHTFQFGPIFI